MLMIKYISTFIGITIILFILFKNVPVKILAGNYSPSSYALLGLKYPLFIQYFYFVYDIVTVNMGNIINPIYSGSVSRAMKIFLPETLFITILGFIVSISISYKIGFFLGFRSKKREKLDVNVFPLVIFYFLIPFVFIAIFNGILAVLPPKYILPAYIVPYNYNWIKFVNNDIFITQPTNILFFDGIIHHSPIILINYLKNFAMPFVSLIIPSTVYLSIFTKRLTSIEYNKKYIRIRIVKNIGDDKFIYHIKRNIRYTMLNEFKTIFGLFLGGEIIISYIFSYMNLGEFLVYSIMNYKTGIFGVIESIFIFTMAIFIFNMIIDIITAAGAKNEDYI